MAKQLEREVNQETVPVKPGNDGAAVPHNGNVWDFVMGMTADGPVIDYDIFESWTPLDEAAKMRADVHDYADRAQYAGRERPDCVGCAYNKIAQAMILNGQDRYETE